MSSLWEKEEQTVHFKNFPKNSEKYKEHQKILEAIKGDFWDKAKQAVQEKYLTFCKNNYLDNMMQWRLRYLACRFTKEDNVVIKIRLGMLKSAVMAQTQLVDKTTGLITKEYNSLGAKVEETPALLDPDLSLDEAKKRHQAYTAVVHQVKFTSE